MRKSLIRSHCGELEDVDVKEQGHERARIRYNSPVSRVYKAIRM
jgi:hypothetical protein